MPIRLVKQPVILYRNGVRTAPTVGYPFEFSDDEVKRVMALNPRALAYVIRPVEVQVSPAPLKPTVAAFAAPVTPVAAVTPTPAAVVAPVVK